MISQSAAKVLDNLLGNQQQKCKQQGHEKNTAEYICISKTCTKSRIFCESCLSLHDSHKDQVVVDNQFAKIIENYEGSSQYTTGQKNLVEINQLQETISQIHTKSKTEILQILTQMEKNFEKNKVSINSACLAIENDPLNKQLASIKSAKPGNVGQIVNQIVPQITANQNGFQLKQDATYDKNLAKLNQTKEYLVTLKTETISFYQELLKYLQEQNSFYNEMINPHYLVLLAQLKENNCLKTEEVEAVMKSIDRADFVKQNCYVDGAQKIGYNTTISAPHMHAMTLEFLKDQLKTSKKCLDIGTGSGFMALAMKKMMEDEEGMVYALDHVEGILKLAEKNIRKNHEEYVMSGKIQFVLGDGRNGLPDYAPYDVIHLGAAATMEAVQHFIDQLSPDGILCGPIINKSGKGQDFTLLKKAPSGETTSQKVLSVIYGPLVSKEEQWPEGSVEQQSDDEK